MASPEPHAGPGSLLVDCAAGTIGGVAGIITGAPLDVVKTRVQNAAQPLRMRDAIRTILRQEGVGAFFKGTLAAAISQIPNNAIVFGAWAAGRRGAATMDLAGRLGVRHDAEAREAIHVFAAGSFSGTLQSLALGPFEHVKIQQQMYGSTRAHGARAHLTLTACTRAILAAGGPRLIFRGTAATLLRDGPVYGAYFLSYEYGKHWLALRAAGADGARELAAGRVLTNERVPVPAWAMLVSGALAGVLSWVLALPVDVVKSQIQAAPVGAPAGSTRIGHVTRRLYREGGLPIFFRGLVPCLVRAAPVNAVTFLGFEWAHGLITRHVTAAS